MVVVVVEELGGGRDRPNLAPLTLRGLGGRGGIHSTCQRPHQQPSSPASSAPRSTRRLHGQQQRTPLISLRCSSVLFHPTQCSLSAAGGAQNPSSHRTLVADAARSSSLVPSRGSAAVTLKALTFASSYTFYHFRKRMVSFAPRATAKVAGGGPRARPAQPCSEGPGLCECNPRCPTGVLEV